VTTSGSGGTRLLWPELPAALRAELEARLGSAVVEAVSQSGGYSPGLASRLRLADGRRVFVKAVSPERNPDTAVLLRDEARNAAALPEGLPAPRFLWGYDDGHWVALAFEDVEGRMPAQPWRRGELDRILRALAELAEQLTPAPIEAPTVAARYAEELNGWRLLAAAGPRPGLDPWAESNLERLAELEASWPQASAGSTLLHTDIRADNILLTPTRVYFVDWSYLCVGAAWIDLLLMLPSVALQGGPEPEEILSSHPVGQRADPAAATVIVAALTGYFVERSLRPPPRGLPTVRAFQAAQGEVALRWLQQRLGTASRGRRPGPTRSDHRARPSGGPAGG